MASQLSAIQRYPREIVKPFHLGQGIERFFRVHPIDQAGYLVNSNLLQLVRDRQTALWRSNQ